MMDNDHDLQRRRYRLCLLGFGMTATSILLLAVDCALNLGLRLSLMQGRPAPWGWFMITPAYHWLIGAPITWLALIGTFLLVGRWDAPSWQRRASLLVVMNMVDAVLWAVENGPALGLMDGEPGHLWFRIKLAQALGWAELALIAGLAADLAVHLGAEGATESSRTTRSLAAIGALVWMVMFVLGTNWAQPFWPLEPRRIRFVPAFLLTMSTLFLQTIISFQVAALGFLAASRCRQVLAEIDLEEKAADPLKSRSEDTDLLAADHPWREAF